MSESRASYVWTPTPTITANSTEFATGQIITLDFQASQRPWGLVRDHYRDARRWLKAAASILERSDVEGWHVLSPFDDTASERMTQDEAAFWCCLQAAAL